MNHAYTIYIFLYVSLYWWHTSLYVVSTGGLLALFLIKTLVEKRVAWGACVTLFTSYCLLGVVVGFIQGDAVASVKVYLLPAIVLICLHSARFSERKMGVFTAYAAIVFLFGGLYMYFQESFGNFNLTIDHALTRNRGDGYYLLDESEVLGSTVIAPFFMISFICSLFVLMSKAGAGVLFGVVAALSLLFQVLAGSRTAFVGSILSASLFFLGGERAGVGKVVLYTALFVLVVTVSLMLALEYSPDAIYRYTRMTEGQADSSLLLRFFLWDNAYRLINENILGYGPSYFFSRFGYTTHNEILGIAVSTGVLGVLMWLSFMIGLAYKLSRSDVSRDIKILFLNFILMYLFIGLTENSSFSNGAIVFPFLVITFGMISGFPVSRSLVETKYD